MDRNKIIFFDLDGTLINIEERWYKLHLDFCLKYNLKNIEKELYINYKKNRLSELEILKKNNNDIELIKEYDKDRIHNIENLDYLKYDFVFSDTVEVLEKLKENYKLVLITKRKNKKNCIQQLKNLGLHDYFNKILISNEGKEQEILKNFNLEEIKNSLLISDAEEDIKVGYKLKMKSISVDYGCRDSKLMTGLGEFGHISQIYEIFNFLNTKKTSIAIETSMLDGRKAKGTAIVLGAYLDFLKKYDNILDITLIHKFKSDENVYGEYKEIIIPRVWNKIFGGFINELLFFLKYRLDVFLGKKELFDIYFHAHSRLLPSFIFAPGKKYMFHAMDGGPVTAGFGGQSREVFPWFVRFFKNKIDIFLALSKFGQKGIVETAKVPIKKVPYIYNGVEDFFKPSESVLKDKKYLIEKYNYPEKYLLCVSRWDPHKNILNTLEAYKEYRKKSENPLPLVFIGGKHMPDYSIIVENKIKDLGLEEFIIVSKFVQTDDLPKAYSCAEMLIFVSFYEGFGLPVVEAMKCGCPVICSNNSSLDEIGGPAALKVNPYSVLDISEAILKIENDDILKRQMIQDGYEWSRQFSWQKSTENLVKIFKKLSV